MLLGSQNQKVIHQPEGALIAELLSAKRFAEAYSLLKEEPQTEVATQFNLALCHYFAQSYNEALACLQQCISLLIIKPSDKIHPADSFYRAIMIRQNQTDTYLQAVNSKYVALFTETVKDSVLRLMVDCWLKLEKWDQVIETAGIIKHKAYKNVTDALLIAEKHIR